MIKHKHHIIPKHIGGTDDPDNIIELTIEEHAEAHRKLYEEYGRWQDRVAWLSLSGIMKEKERIYEIVSNSNKGNPSGYKHSEEVITFLSESRKGDKNPMYGKPAHNRGKKFPGVGGRPKGIGWSESERKTHELVRSRPGYYAYTQDPERNRKISESNKGRFGPSTGKKWFNDGSKEIYAFECPTGFVTGRKPRKQTGKLGLNWYNNGEINKQFRDNEVTIGFIRGRISKK